MMSSYIYDAVRSPRGKAKSDGGLASLAPQELVRQLLVALDARGDGLASQADTLVLGCVGQVGAQGANIALVSKLWASLPDETSAISINNYCVSGLSAIGQAAMRVSSGTDRTVLAGGVEQMSSVGMMADRAEYYRDARFAPRARFLPVPVAADRLAQGWGISRETLDACALTSQSRSVAAEATPGFNASRIVIQRRDGGSLGTDECVRATTPEKLASLEPAFAEIADAYAGSLEGETVIALHTIAHAPPMCDAAALALIGPETLGDARPRARIVAFAESGGDPAQSLTAGFAAMEKVLARADLSLEDMDRIEFMEAFAVTIARFLSDDRVEIHPYSGRCRRGRSPGW